MRAEFNFYDDALSFDCIISGGNAKKKKERKKQQPETENISSGH